MAKILDKLLRSIIPSTAILSHSKLFGFVHAVAEFLPRRAIRLFTDAPLPPGRLIVRIGVGNTILRPHLWYLTSSAHYWMYYMSRGSVSLDSIIVDVGSGVGRSAVALRDFRYHDARFTGHYFGFDVDAEMVDWCQRNFPSDRFTFTQVDVPNRLYNESGTNQRALLNIGDAAGRVDFIFSQSLLTHLLEDDVRHNLSEAHRLLRPGGVLAMTFFCMEDLKERNLLGGRWRFQHRVGDAYVENPKHPEAAVGYQRQWMLDACRGAGFSEVGTELPDFQTTVYAIK
ncbi:class I SAM-dependent methyltransferase [Halochromatium glycolicum]|uniref:Methyltransferase type 11 domain-containing protein n=1 Tax=Halochromatium glycolicum TaxID=85075 RepID=A0AAJ0X7L9_9GAMM|nr:class I SAM-dependent methyltransferase [Halochromatium glycolicum]MBK1703176.1 hypothetical protein [Halochromatium glycolicum]